MEKKNSNPVSNLGKVSAECQNTISFQKITNGLLFHVYI